MAEDSTEDRAFGATADLGSDDPEFSNRAFAGMAATALDSWKHGTRPDAAGNLLVVHRLSGRSLAYHPECPSEQQAWPDVDQMALVNIMILTVCSASLKVGLHPRRGGIY